MSEPLLKGDIAGAVPFITAPAISAAAVEDAVGLPLPHVSTPYVIVIGSGRVVWDV